VRTSIAGPISTGLQAPLPPLPFPLPLTSQFEESQSRFSIL
jgi:hypothetical protein